jgi:hypothetical protein
MHIPTSNFSAPDPSAPPPAQRRIPRRRVCRWNNFGRGFHRTRNSKPFNN